MNTLIPRRDRALFAGVFCALTVVAGGYALASEQIGDYGSVACNSSQLCDDPALAIDALADGDLGRFVHDQPIAGPVSVVLRAPVVALARTGGADLVREYQAGAFVCLLGLALLGAGVAVLARREGSRVYVQVAGPAAVMINPVTSMALVAGHPEEALTGALAVGAVLLASRNRPRAAAVVLAIALATKLWALFAVIPVLALVGRRELLRTAVVCLGVSTALMLPFAAGDPSAFWGRLTSVNRFGAEAGTLTQSSAWWALGEEAAFDRAAVIEGETVVVRQAGWKLDATAARIAHPALLLLAAGLALLWAVRARSLDDKRATVLALVALLFLLRGPLDPGNHSYYHEPLILALVCWETIGRKRLPVVSGLLALGLGLLREGPRTLGDAKFNAVYLSGVGCLAVYLVYATYCSGTVTRHGPEARRHRTE